METQTFETLPATGLAAPAARLLDRENQRLHEKIKTLLAEIARLRGEDSAVLQRELAFLQELLAQRNQALFGQRERRVVHDKTDPESLMPPVGSPTQPVHLTPRRLSRF
jgi:transposase